MLNSKALLMNPSAEKDYIIIEFGVNYDTREHGYDKNSSLGSCDDPKTRFGTIEVTSLVWVGPGFYYVRLAGDKKGFGNYVNVYCYRVSDGSLLGALYRLVWQAKSGEYSHNGQDPFFSEIKAGEKIKLVYVPDK